MKQSYHPAVQLAHFLNFLPKEIEQQMPRSTLHDLKHRNQSELVGFDWFLENRVLFESLGEIATNQQLLRMNQALIKVIALKKQLDNRVHTLHDKIFTSHILNLKKIFGIHKTLKLLDISYQKYYEIRKPDKCKFSLIGKCFRKYPNQLLPREVSIIKKYCLDQRYIHWSLASVYEQIKRDGISFFARRTFYSYVKKLNLQRVKSNSRRKNHTTGIRANQPLEILHVDTTMIRLLDNTKAFIHIIIDNFSRKILAYKITTSCNAQNTLDNLNSVYHTYLKDKPIATSVITDDGSENHGVVTHFFNSSLHPHLKHLIAQTPNFTFSNSMVENVFKRIKYDFLYHKTISNFYELLKYVPLAIHDFENRPHAVLNGLTPVEVFNGNHPDEVDYSKEFKIAREIRKETNKHFRDCYVIASSKTKK